MSKAKDGCQVALANQISALRALHRYGWLRTRDLACLNWQKMAKAPSSAGPSLAPPQATPSDIRNCQRLLAQLRKRRMILSTQAPNGSLIHALSERGARALQGLGVLATTGKDLVREYRAAYFLHRCVANEVAISGSLEGYRVSTERETSQGRWLGGMAGVMGKKPDVLLRAGDTVWWVEVERRKNQHDYIRLLTWLDAIWRPARRLGEAAPIGDGLHLKQVVFVCSTTIGKKLATDMQSKGWSADLVASRIRFETSLYNFRTIMFF